MIRSQFINDRIQRACKEAKRAIDGMSTPGYDYGACVKLATDAMQEFEQEAREREQ